MGTEDTAVEDTFDADFAAAAEAAEKGEAAPAPAEKTADEIAADAKAVEDAQKVTDDAAAAKKVEDDAAAAKALQDAKPADQVAAEAKAASDAAAAAKVAADAAAAAKAAADAAAAETAKTDSEAAKAAKAKLDTELADYVPTDDEKVAIDNFVKNFPTEKVAIDAHMKQLSKSVDQRVFKAVQDALSLVYKDLTPLAKTTAEVAQERHVTAIRTAVPDFDAVVDKLPAWIKTQPAYLQPAMQRTYDEGSAQDVIALANDYKKAVGIVAADPVAAAAKAKAEKEAADKAAAKAKADKDAADLVAVKSRRSTPTPTGTKDPNDFDGAFAEAADALK